MAFAAEHSRNQHVANQPKALIVLDDRAGDEALGAPVCGQEFNHLMLDGAQVFEQAPADRLRGDEARRKHVEGWRGEHPIRSSVSA